jgi:diguanylate cyclase (GGDEF)-like protein
VDAQAALVGISAVLEGSRDSFGLDYEMVVEGESLWYHLEVLPLRGNEGAVITHFDITRRRLVEEELGYRSGHDLLTGLANRQALLDRLGEAVEAGSPAGLVLIDLDGFRDINDAFGHFYGDRLLETVATRLEATAEEGHVVARLGGDEFALLAVGIAEDWNHEQLCQRIRQSLAEPVNLDITSVRPSASLGVVMRPPHTGDAEAMLRDADTALYVSKESGRDRWTLFRDDQRVTARARAVSLARVEAALADEEFVLHVQPFIDLVSGHTVGVEALLRWQHPEEGLLAPGTFLLAIESGPMLDQVGAWVIDTALATLRRWQTGGAQRNLLMSVNVSPRQLGRGQLPRLVAAALDRHQISPESLGLEVLETAILTSGAAVEAELRELHDMGVQIAIDDFGTGYSALAYLQAFPVDGVKIDRAFVQRSGTPRGARLLRAAGELARAVDATSVAEGIETPAELAVVQGAGIAWGQGYLLGRPAPAGDQPPVSAVLI